MDKAIHCADEFDEKQWVPTDDTCSTETHENIKAGISAFQNWIVRATEAISRSQISVIGIPRTTGKEFNSLGFAYDPTQAYLLVAQVQRKDIFALGNAFYVVLVVQQPTGEWRAVTGFFVPFCTQCATYSQDKVSEWILSGLELPVTIKTRDHKTQIPEAIREHDGWFREGSRSRLIGAFQIIGPYPRLATNCWVTRGELELTFETESVLVCVGPVGEKNENLFLIPSFEEEHKFCFNTFEKWGVGLERLGQFRFRQGTTSDLIALSGGLKTSANLEKVVLSSFKTGLTRAKAPNTLGVVWVDRSAQETRPKLVRNIREFIRDLNKASAGEKKLIIECWSWPETKGAYNWDDINWLLRYVDSLA